MGIFGGGMRRVEFVLPHVRGKEVLDVGVVQHTAEAYDQPNWLHRHVCEAARRCVGIDTLAPEVERLAQMGYDVLVADAHGFDLGERFDVVLAADVIEHLHDHRGFFESVDRHLRDRGELIITTPNPWFWLRIAGALRGRVHENPEHTLWLSPGTLAELLRRHGFELESVVFGSSEAFLYKIPLVPPMIAHTSIFAIARRA